MLGEDSRMVLMDEAETLGSSVVRYFRAMAYRKYTRWQSITWGGGSITTA